jgi:glycosyltransferase involved in cell wall biosynthesis
VTYYRSPIRDKRYAWNSGANIAQGEIIVFADEHDRPDELWLLNSRSHSLGSDIIAMNSARNACCCAKPNRDTAIPIVPDNPNPNPQCLAVRSRALRWGGGLAPDDSGGTDARQVPMSISFVTTWAEKCGIAEYSRNIAKELLQLGCNVNVYSPINRNTIPIIPDAKLEAHHDSWSNKDCSFLANMEKLGSIIWFQHHIAFYHLGDTMIRCCNSLRDHGKLPVITLHSTLLLHRLDDHSRASAARCLNDFALVFVHTTNDIENLRTIGVESNVMLMPHGVKRSAVASACNGGSMRIGCFGFLFPHKGVYDLLTAYAEIVRYHKHSIEPLRLITSVRVESSSTGEYHRCKELIDRLGIGDRVEWYTEYLTLEEIDRLLSECDLVVMPYQDTPESASGAVRTVLASCARVGTSPSRIFDEVRDATFAIGGYDAESIRRFIEKAIDGFDAESVRKIDATRDEWLARLDWGNVAREYDKVFRVALKMQNRTL